MILQHRPSATDSSAPKANGRQAAAMAAQAMSAAVRADTGALFAQTYAGRASESADTKAVSVSEQ